MDWKYGPINWIDVPGEEKWMQEVGKELTEGLENLWKKQWVWKLVEMCEEDKLNGWNNDRTMGKLPGEGK